MGVLVRELRVRDMLLVDVGVEMRMEEWVQSSLLLFLPWLLRSILNVDIPDAYT